MDSFWIAVQCPFTPTGFYPDNCDTMKQWVRQKFSPKFIEKAPEACTVDNISLIFI